MAVISIWWIKFNLSTTSRIRRDVFVQIYLWRAEMHFWRRWAWCFDSCEAPVALVHLKPVGEQLSHFTGKWAHAKQKLPGSRHPHVNTPPAPRHNINPSCHTRYVSNNLPAMRWKMSNSFLDRLQIFYAQSLYCFSHSH